MYRDTLCAETKDKIGKNVKIAGWLAVKRNYGGLLFFEIRDHTAIVQVVFNNPDDNLAKIPLESVIMINGLVIEREKNAQRTDIITGQVEIQANNVEIISYANPLPFLPGDNVNEETGLKYRYIDLRSEKMQKLLKKRAKLLDSIRLIMKKDEFIEIETPIVTASSPEGARDFLIPSRLFPGKFYALPQSPQIFKQLLMVSGFNKYFQIAPCFRDEDTRKDRLYGTFYQLDCEMSFVTQDMVTDFLVKTSMEIMKLNSNKKIILHPPLRYNDAIEKYATDKPHLGKHLFIENWTEKFKKSEMKLFKDKIEKENNIVKVIRCNFVGNRDSILEYCQTKNFRVAYVYRGNDDNIKGPIAQFISTSEIEKNETIFFICDKINTIQEKATILRNYLNAENFIPTNPNELHLVLIKDFPMFEFVDNKWEFTHNPFSMPQIDYLIKKTLSADLYNDLAVKDLSDPLKVFAFQYDLVLNGFEICSGSIRNYDPELLIKCFEICGYSREEVEQKFFGIINAFKFGVPPHGGFAIGIDRLLMILEDELNVRCVCAFPLSASGKDPLLGAPTEVSAKQLKELNLVFKS